MTWGFWAAGGSIEEGFLTAKTLFGMTGLFLLVGENPRCRPEGAALREAFGRAGLVLFLFCFVLFLRDGWPI